MEKINIVELLKDCPEGMELDCLMFDNLVFSDVDEGAQDYPIEGRLPNGELKWFASDGRYELNENAKCVIFPKGKTTWEGFVPPCKFKDGDIVYTHTDNYVWISIFKQISENVCRTYIDFCIKDNDLMIDTGVLCKIEEINTQRIATEEEKEKLLQAIKDNGYRWNTETKTLEKLIKPKFKVGDWIMIDKPCQIISINDNGNYIVQYCDDEKTHELSKNFCESHFHRWTIQDAKDGDVLTTDTVYFIFKSTDKLFCYMHCNYSVISNDFNTSDTAFVDSEYVHPATTEQRDILFQKIKETGYKWNKETKTLESLIEPKFKYEDVIQYEPMIVRGIDCITFSEQDGRELVPNKFDVNTLVPFESRVLVRSESCKLWKPAIFGCCVKGAYSPYYALGGTCWKYCIPYEGNEHLLGKADDCDDYYKNW